MKIFFHELRDRARREAGLSLIEALVALGLSAVLLAGLVQQYSTSTAMSYNQSIRVATILEAQAILQAIGLELRMIGNGVPFDQANFQIGENTLTDPTVTEPLDVATASATELTFRINETGDVFLLTADFNPASSFEIALTDTSSLDVGDPIYLTNSVVSGEDGLFGIVNSVNHGSKTVTLAAGFVVSPDATFPMGSILEEVATVTYRTDGNTITRDSGFGPVVMAQNSTLNLEYLDAEGNVLDLPLTNETVVNSLRAIRVSVTHTSEKALKGAGAFSTTVDQVFGIRNLIYLY